MAGDLLSSSEKASRLRWCLNRDLKEVKNRIDTWVKTFQAEGTASAKALRREHDACLRNRKRAGEAAGRVGAGNHLRDWVECEGLPGAFQKQQLETRGPH